MQIYALDNSNTLIFANEAAKHSNYHCIECRDVVRLRSGLHRKAHFYHLKPNGACRLHAKGMPHLMLQYYLKERLPEGESDLEYRFASIGRIADVAWHPQKIIFEIQCSPISPKEIIERNTAYASAGYQVVWILHDARYNRTRLSAAEQVLCRHTHYFSDMDAEGKGRIYDQLSIVENGIRTFRLAPFEFIPDRPQCHRQESLKRLPEPIRVRARHWMLGFGGDTLDTYLKYRRDGVDSDQFISLEERYGYSIWKNVFKHVRKAITRCVIIPYQSVLKLMLERACR